MKNKICILSAWCRPAMSRPVFVLTAVSVTLMVLVDVSVALLQAVRLAIVVKIKRAKKIC